MFDICTYNAGNADKDRVERDLSRLARRYQVVGLQEVADQKKAMNATGAQVLTGDGNGEGKVALLVAPGVSITATGYVPCTKRTRVGSWGAGPGVTDAKGIRWATVVLDCGPVTIGSTHLVSSVQRPARGPIARLGRRRRLALYRKHVAGIVAWVESVEGPLVIVGDFNAVPEFELLDPLRKAGLTCASAPSHGKRAIDHLWSRGLDPVAAAAEALDGYSSDHKPVTTTYEHQGEPVPTPNPIPDRLERVTYGGKPMDNGTKYAVMSAEAILGYELTITQGCYSDAVGASAGTHKGGGVVDLAPWDQANKVKVLRDIGWAAWYRPAVAGLWPAHIHAVLIGHPSLSVEAQSQVAKYRRGEDGLADPPTRDPNPYRPQPEPAFDYRAAVRDERLRVKNVSLKARIQTLRDRISANRNRITYK